MRKELTKEKQVLDLARKAKILRVQDLAEKGIHPEHLRRLYQRGLLIRMGRGVYMLPNARISGNFFSRGGGKEGTARHYMSTVGAPFP
jgi:predicted transcriptional regulator of viral defense system